MRRHAHIGKMVGCLILGFMTATLAHADMYKWTDANGEIHFSDTPRTDQAPLAIASPKSSPQRNKKLPLGAPQQDANKTTVVKGARPSVSPVIPNLTTPEWQIMKGSLEGASAQVVRWTDEQGIDHYSDLPVASIKDDPNVMKRIEDLSQKRDALIKQTQTKWNELPTEEKDRLRQQGEQLRTEEESAWKAANPKQQRAHMMALLAPFLEQMAKACETGKTDNCATVGLSKYRSQDLAGARRYYGLGCQQGDKSSCYDLIQMEAVSGLPSQARQLFATHCATSTISPTPPEKGNRCPTLQVIVQTLPAPEGLGRVPLPSMLKERLSMETNLLQLALPKQRQEYLPKLFQAADPAQQTGAAGQSYAEGIRLAFGIDRAVDLTKAEAQLQKAADQGMNVGERLFVLTRELSNMSGKIIDSDSAITHFKMRWVLQKSCDFGRSDACQFLAVTEQQ
ncbi:MAG: DUF4124 domain-containing protein, partial [Nitrospira sp.]